jgi:hypothetical protein
MDEELRKPQEQDEEQGEYGSEERGTLPTLPSRRPLSKLPTVSSRQKIAMIKGVWRGELFPFTTAGRTQTKAG